MMKLKRTLLGLACGITILSGCNDELNLVGPTIQPGGDKVAVYTDTFRLDASTVLMNAVYAKTDTGLLGEIYDPLYGNLKADYICQFYCPNDFSFNHTPVDGKIDSVEFHVLYNTWVGDSLTPMKAQVYLVNKPLDKYFYTDMNPANYCDMQTILGSQTYSAYDTSVPDSVRNSSDGYTSTVRVRLSQSFGQNLYDESVNHPSTFKNQDAFNQYLPGFYVTNTFGTGNMLNVIKSYFMIYYRYTVKGSTGQDSIVSTVEPFTNTKEVIQLNRVQNANLEALIQPSNDYTYLKTPAGVCTRILIPTTQIAPVVEGRILNNLPLTFTAMPQEAWKYALAPPKRLLLVPEDSVKAFFEQAKVNDKQMSFVSGNYNASTMTYSFGNISNAVANQIKNAPDKDLVMWVIPVNYTSKTYYGAEYPTSVTNYLSPAGVKLRKDGDMTQFVITSSKYNTATPTD